ncbi:hypothetical protein [[Mycobacterium] burgundiense]|uniref:Uncharacterized protein n=1 Tax=[Mycobacterium] burgundiense TaxID=3064286 RepID=A0ABM9LD49_9MYCO|nr:hypothetical protein [Mycolicibacterium sp. MU0053]CAJ1497000.1 hypothetical protein MU0053_000796 [Mycolicibacterium sp. MU0053]
METGILLRGIELRYVLTVMLANGGEMTVHELVHEIDRQGFTVAGRPSKTVSDALRWEIGHGRVSRYGHGRYGLGIIPKSTEYRIWRRVADLRERARSRREEGWAA